MAAGPALEFVASNVPSLDDEEEILQSLLKRFARELDYSTKTLVIDRYDSLHLLNQSIFVLDRPRSRLSRVYRALMRRITRRNLDDREAALAAMSAERTRWSGTPHDPESRTDAEVRIKEIISRHPDDAEILCEAARFCSDQEQWSVARILSSRALDVAMRKRDALSYRYALQAIGYRIQGGKGEDDVHDLLELLDLEVLEFDDVIRAVNLLQQISDEPPIRIVSAKSFGKLEDRELGILAAQMHASHGWERIAWRLLYRGEPPTELREPSDIEWMAEAAIVAIGIGEFDAARRLLRRLGSFKVLQETSIRDHFNFAMATWGADQRTLPVDLFKVVVTLDSQSTERPGNANYCQCLALANFVSGEKEQAQFSLNMARRIASSVPFSHFSCWSYLELPSNKFLRDLDEMERYFHGEAILPEFMRQQPSTETLALEVAGGQ